MAILIVLLRITLVLVCLLLVGVILLQRNKGGGAGVSFGGGAEAVFGAQMGDVLTKSTVILGIIFLANTLALSLLQARGAAGGGGWLEAEAKAQQQRMAAAAQAEAAAIPLDDFADSDTAAALDDIVRADTAAETEADVSLDATAALPDTPPIATESAAPAATVEPEAAAE